MSLHLHVTKVASQSSEPYPVQGRWVSASLLLMKVSTGLQLAHGVAAEPIKKRGISSEEQ